jgi:uncharacterized protein YciI
MMILAIARVDPQTTLEKLQPHLEAETKHAWQLYSDGVFREVYDRQDHRGVVIVLECASADEARVVLDDLPFVRQKLIDFEIIPLGPFPYFEMLFRDYAPPQQGGSGSSPHLLHS